MKYYILTFLAFSLIACGGNNSHQNNNDSAIDKTISSPPVETTQDKDTSHLITDKSTTTALPPENNDNKDNSVNNKNETDSKVTSKPILPKGNVYILEQQPNISTGLANLPFEPDFAYVSNYQLFFGEGENFTTTKVPIQGEILSLSWGANRQELYFTLKIEANAASQKVFAKMKQEGYAIDVYDLNIYKIDLKNPSSAEYITTLFDKTTAYSESDYFEGSGPGFEASCSGDTLIVSCESAVPDGGFYSKYIVSLPNRQTSFHDENDSYLFSGCSSKGGEKYMLKPEALDFKIAGDNLKVFQKVEGKENQLILNHDDWTSLFENNPFRDQIMTTIREYAGYSSCFNFSLSPDLKKVLYGAYNLGEMDIRTGATYLYDREKATHFPISDKLVLGSWYDADFEWLPNSNILLNCIECKHLLLIDTKENRIDKIDNVTFFQSAPF